MPVAAIESLAQVVARSEGAFAVVEIAARDHNTDSSPYVTLSHEFFLNNWII